MYYSSYGQMNEYTQRTLPVATSGEAQGLVDAALEWHLRHQHTIVSSTVEETPAGFVGVVVYQMEGERAQISIGDRTAEQQDAPAAPIEEAKSRTGLYVGLGLGVLALGTIGYVVVRGRKRG